MSETKFTPGPWQVRFGNIGNVKAENGALIAKCQRLTSLCNLQANAHLIAAAPELYEALEATLEQAIGCFHNHYGEDPSGTHEPEYIQNARAALAKARGETP